MKKIPRAIVFPILVLASLATVTGLAGNIDIPSDKVNLSGIALAQTRSANITISLPSLADVYLKDGTKLSGRVMKIDSQRQELTLQRGNESRIYAFAEIDKVIYRRDSPFYRYNRPPHLLIIRGSESQTPPQGEKTTWATIPLGNLSMRDATRGLVNVNLEGILSRSQLRGILSVASNATYVVDEISFEAQDGTVTILATPY